MLTTDLDYDLPPELIATQPAHPRDAARLMVIDRQSDQVTHRRVSDLPDLVSAKALPHGAGVVHPGDLMVFNHSRVLPACFKATRVATGGQVTGLYLRSTCGADGSRWQVMLESRGRLQAGESIALDDRSTLQLIEPLGDGRWVGDLRSPEDGLALLNRIGQPPLPPYIRRQRRLHNQPERQPQDAAQYNTVYATEPGSVAAPTAGLHFTSALLDRLTHAGIQRAAVTLHVGLGTFAPVRTAQVEDHPIHEEWIAIPAATIEALRQARQSGQRIIPVGTTTVRALESLPQRLPDAGDYCASTRLFITPPGRLKEPTPQDNTPACFKGFRYTDGLMTNFHLPRSTLLAMVAALPGVGVRRLKAWYQLAIEHRYRFYSYGDAMLIL